MDTSACFWKHCLLPAACSAVLLLLLLLHQPARALPAADAAQPAPVRCSPIVARTLAKSGLPVLAGC